MRRHRVTRLTPRYSAASDNVKYSSWDSMGVQVFFTTCFNICQGVDGVRTGVSVEDRERGTRSGSENPKFGGLQLEEGGEAAVALEGADEGDGWRCLRVVRFADVLWCLAEKSAAFV
jgi:hypothetical protein